MGSRRPVPVLAMALFFAAHQVGGATVPAMPQSLAAHRAVYDLKLARAEPASGVTGVIGRLVFEFLGDSCSGYVTNMRWINRMFIEDGTEEINDLRSSSWEAGDGEAFGFSATQYVDSKLTDATQGTARRSGRRAIAVELNAPEEKTMSFDGELAFPTQHMLAVIEAARDGRRILQMRVFDGSETGDKVYETTAVIGAVVRPASREAVAPGAERLEGLSIWPVTISYFDADGTGEARPVYQYTFRLYENGVSDSILLDYGDVALRGRISEIEFLPESGCK